LGVVERLASERLRIKAVLVSRLLRACSGCSEDELKALRYMLAEVSVGDLIALKDLAERLGSRDKARATLRSLMARGLVEEGRDSYNLAKWVRELLARLCESMTKCQDIVEAGRVASRWI
jgi:predicted transcriptional regulator